jgi:hypothetical protein
VRLHLNREKKLALVVSVCHSSYSAKPKIAGLQSRPARAERPYLKNIQRKQAGILEFKFQYWDPPATKKKKKKLSKK